MEGPEGLVGLWMGIIIAKSVRKMYSDWVGGRCLVHGTKFFFLPFARRSRFALRRLTVFNHFESRILRTNFSPVFFSLPFSSSIFLPSFFSFLSTDNIISIIFPILDHQQNVTTNYFWWLNEYQSTSNSNARPSVSILTNCLGIWLLINDQESSGFFISFRYFETWQNRFTLHVSHVDANVDANYCYNPYEASRVHHFSL